MEITIFKNNLSCEPFKIKGSHFTGFACFFEDFQLIFDENSNVLGSCIYSDFNKTYASAKTTNLFFVVKKSIESTKIYRTFVTLPVSKSKRHY